MIAVVPYRNNLANLLRESVYDNPVLVRDMRARMRGGKAFGIMGVYVILMAAVMLGVAFATGSFAPTASPGAATKIGPYMFVGLTWAQTILLALLIPSLSSGAISQEIERKTMDLLALTPLTAGKLVVGKQLAVLLYALALVLVSAPLAGLCVMFGGLSPAEVAVTYLMLAAWSFVLSAAGVFWSAMHTRTASASGAAAGTALLYLGYTGFGGIGFHMGGRGASWWAHMNPGWTAVYALERVPICGIQVPAVLLALIWTIALGALLMLVASTHVQHKVAERALSIRLLLLGITVFGTWASVGGAVSGYDPTQLVSHADSTLNWIALFAVVFAAGEVKKPGGQSMAGYVFSVRKVFKSDIGGAISFILLYILVSHVSFGAVYYWAVLAGGASLKPGFWIAYLLIGAVMLATATGLAAIGILASTVTKSLKAARWATALAIIALQFTGSLAEHSHSVGWLGFLAFGTSERMRSYSWGQPGGDIIAESLPAVLSALTYAAIAYLAIRAAAHVVDRRDRVAAPDSELSGG